MNTNISYQMTLVREIRPSRNIKEPISTVGRNATSSDDNKDLLASSDGHTSLKELIEDRIIYQNPLLMAQAVENAVSEVKEFQPNIAKKYKVNPVKAIYDSERAHD